jgi:hypothetical protein
MGIPSGFSSSFGFQELKNRWGKDLVYTLLFSIALGAPSTYDFLLFHSLVLVFPSFLLQLHQPACYTPSLAMVSTIFSTL